MELPRVLVEILAVFKFLWTLFTVDSPKPILFSNKPFRILHLPSLAHDVIFTEMSIKELYHLSKCSRRSRYAVRMFTHRQKYYFSITVMKSYCSLDISNRLDRKTFYRVLRPTGFREPLFYVSYITYHSEDFWAAMKEEILYFFDVFTKKVNRLNFHDITNIKKMTEFLKEKTFLPLDSVVYGVNETDDEMYKYVLREFKDTKKLEICSSPSADFRFDDMEPFTGEYVMMKNADWLTFDNLTRCFTNLEKIRLWTYTDRYLTVHVFNQFLTAWINGLRVGKLHLWFGCIYFNVLSIFKNIPKTEVKRVKVENEKRVFKDGQCFLIRQEESGVGALVYFNNHYTFLNHSICFTTNFRLLRDDESDR